MANMWDNSGGSPFELLDARALGRALGDIPGDEVAMRRARGELFAVSVQSQGVDRLYPAFQAWSGINGAPLRQVLQALGPEVDDAGALIFFMTRSEDSGHLTPVEVLRGHAGPGAGTLSKDAEAILAMPHKRRLAGVEAMARAFSSQSAA